VRYLLPFAAADLVDPDDPQGLPAPMGQPHSTAPSTTAAIVFQFNRKCSATAHHGSSRASRATARASACVTRCHLSAHGKRSTRQPHLAHHTRQGA
jgi:hypothetical protein